VAHRSRRGAEKKRGQGKDHLLRVNVSDDWPDKGSGILDILLEESLLDGRRTTIHGSVL
jgi:hypothetical protein